VHNEASTKQRIRSLMHLKQAVRVVWESGPGWTVANVVLVFVQGVLPLLLLYLMKLVVDSVTAGLAAQDKGGVFEHVGRLIVIAGGVTVFNAVCSSVAGLVKEQQTQIVTDHMNDVLHAKSIEVDLEYYESSEYYDKLHRAQHEGPYRPSSIVNGLVQTAQSGISLVAMAALLFSFHWGVTAILFAAVIPGVVVQLKYAGAMYRWQRGQTPTERQADYFNWMLTGDACAKEVRLFGLGPFLIERYRQLRKQLRRERLQIATRRSVADMVAQAWAAIAVLGSYAFIVYRTVLGVITLGDMVMYFGAFQRGLGNLRQMLGGLASLYEDGLFISYFYEFLNLKQRVIEPPHPRPFPRPIQEGITFDNVGFQYPVDGKKVLENISMAIRRGEIVALVGENGSGKTTLIKLLCRLYDPTEGSIKIDGLDLREFETPALRREIGIVFQDYVHYNVTARENVWFGNLELPPHHEKIAAAARKSGAHDIIARLTRGYDTILGKWFLDGEELSIGEWQKIALARAFLRSAQILVLDEPTSSLDAKAEYDVFRSFRQLSEGRTVILISHRFSTVRMADRIFVLHNGVIMEGGTHHELVRSGGKYASLFEMQAQHYK